MDDSTERILTAVIDRIIPADEFPSASQAGVMNYLRRILATDAQAFLPVLLEGLASLDAGFADLPSDQQDEVLRRVDSTPWFHRLIGLTSEGYYADPGNGGNLGAVSWRMVGYKGEPS